MPSVAPGTPAAVIVAAPPPLAAAPQAVPGAMPAPDAAGMPALPREPEVASATRTPPLARPFEPAVAPKTVPLAERDAAAVRGVPFVPPVLRGSAPLPNAPRRASESSAAFASDATAGPTSASASREPPAPADPRDTDRRFSALVLAAGPLREGAPDAAQRDALQRLEETIRGAPDRHLVPRMPALLPRLLGLVRRDDVSPRELAEPLARDPALLGEVIRLANSPRYRTLRAISSVQEAILLLGQRGLEQLLVRVVMGPVFDGRQGRYSRAAGTRVWDQAERCAHACGWLRRGAHDAFEAYLAGMVANSGLMVALRVLDRHLGDAKAPDTLGFHDALLDATGRLSLLIARQWSFPAAVVAREDWLLGQVAVAHHQRMLYDLLVESNQPLPPMGVKQWSSRLTPGQRELLSALPAPRAESDSVVAAMSAVREAIRTHGRTALEGAGGTWPAEVDDAMSAYWERRGLR